MSTTVQHDSVRLFAEALAVLDNGGDENTLLSVLKTAPDLKKLIERAEVAAVAGLQQLDTFATRGHRKRENAICDLTGDEHWVARHLLTEPTRPPNASANTAKSSLRRYPRPPMPSPPERSACATSPWSRS